MDGRGIGLPGGKRVVKMPEGSGLPRPRMNGLPTRGLPGAGDNKAVPMQGDDVSSESNVTSAPIKGSSLPTRGLPLPMPVKQDEPIVDESTNDVSADVDALINGGLPAVNPLPAVSVPAREGALQGRKVLPEGYGANNASNGNGATALPTRGEKVTTAPTVSLPNGGNREGVRLPSFSKATDSSPVRASDTTSVKVDSTDGLVPAGRVTTGLPAPRVATPVTPPVDDSARVGTLVNPAAGSGKSHGGSRETKRRVLEKSPLAGAERWDDDMVPDTHLGLNAEAAPLKVAKKRKAKFALTTRDIEIITLCARYRFAYREQIQHYFQSDNVRNRLTRLSDEGLLRKDMVTQNQALWLPMQAGLDVADLDLSHIERGRYSATSIAHSVGLLNLGIEFEKGWENLLMEDSWPNFNRAGGEQGEMVITEREITNSFNRLKGIAKGDGKKSADVPRELMQLRNEAITTASGMETREGMAGLFVGFYQNKSHTPDMVIARPRNADGSSNHIAIELELNPKPIPDWIRILRSFKNDPMFKSVVYFTHKRSINNQLSEVNRKHVGLTEEQFKIFKYTPRNNSIPFWG